MDESPKRNIGHADARLSDGDSFEDSTYKVKLDFFEGPLDLLLHLVKKHELDIFDIPVAFVAEKYLEYLDLMRSLNLDVAGEFLLMAATLAHVKSREMLPHDEDEIDEDEQDGEDPKALLIRRLLEYQKYKDVAQRLGEYPQLHRSVWTRPEGPQEKDDVNTHPLAEVGLFKLIEVFNEVMERAKPELTHDVVVDRISLAERINEMADELQTEHRTTFRECLKRILNRNPCPDMRSIRRQLVVTLLAILEMARLKMIRIRQACPDGEIYLERAPEGEEIDSADLDKLQVDDAYE
jgi:segregation and condensation protein A